MQNASEEKGSSGDEKTDYTTPTTAADPVLGRPVSALDIKICPPDVAAAYIKKYNNVIEGKKTLADSPDGRGSLDLSPSESPHRRDADAGGGGGGESVYGSENNRSSTRTAY